MKNITGTFLLFFLMVGSRAQHTSLSHTTMYNTEIIKIESRLKGLTLAVTHQIPKIVSKDYPILFLHGSSFPTALSFGFKMENKSWMDHLSENGYDVFALDFLGYGHADRYPEMQADLAEGKPVGRAQEVYQDVDRAVNYILQKTGKDKLYLIGHSWGGSVAALYATEYPGKLSKLILFAAITYKNDTTEIETMELTYNTLTPEKRIAGMKNLTPVASEVRLEKEVFETWGNIWLASDPLALKTGAQVVRYPSGPSQDVEDLMHNKSYYNPADIQTPTLLIRGEWDQYPNNEDAGKLFSALTRSPHKKYVVIEQGTHVMHLEKSRHQLYAEVDQFLQQEDATEKSNTGSIAVIFEVLPIADHWQKYLDLAAVLKPELEKIEGFISIERFQSISQPEKILSLSFWENEAALQQWRNLEIHRGAQQQGRDFIFQDYRLRVAQVIRDYGMSDRKQAPVDSKNYHHKP